MAQTLTNEEKNQLIEGIRNSISNEPGSLAELSSVLDDLGIAYTVVDVEGLIQQRTRQTQNLEDIVNNNEDLAGFMNARESLTPEEVLSVANTYNEMSGSDARYTTDDIGDMVDQIDRTNFLDFLEFVKQNPERQKVFIGMDGIEFTHLAYTMHTGTSENTDVYRISRADLLTVERKAIMDEAVRLVNEENKQVAYDYLKVEFEKIGEAQYNLFIMEITSADQLSVEFIQNIFDHQDYNPLYGEAYRIIVNSNRQSTTRGEFLENRKNGFDALFNENLDIKDRAIEILADFVSRVDISQSLDFIDYRGTAHTQPQIIHETIRFVAENWNSLSAEQRDMLGNDRVLFENAVNNINYKLSGGVYGNMDVVKEWVFLTPGIEPLLIVEMFREWSFNRETGMFEPNPNIEDASQAFLWKLLLFYRINVPAYRTLTSDGIKFAVYNILTNRIILDIGALNDALGLNLPDTPVGRSIAKALALVHESGHNALEIFRKMSINVDSYLKAQGLTEEGLITALGKVRVGYGTNADITIVNNFINNVLPQIKSAIISKYGSTLGSQLNTQLSEMFSTNIVQNIGRDGDQFGEFLLNVHRMNNIFSEIGVEGIEINEIELVDLSDLNELNRLYNLNRLGLGLKDIPATIQNLEAKVRSLFGIATGVEVKGFIENELMMMSTPKEILKQVNNDIAKYRARNEFFRYIKDKLDPTVYTGQALENNRADVIAAFELALEYRGFDESQRTALIAEMENMIDDTTDPAYFDKISDRLLDIGGTGLLVNMLESLKEPPAEFLVNAREPIPSSIAEIPADLNYDFGNAIIIIDTGFIIDLLDSSKNPHSDIAAQIIKKLAENNELIITEETWNELKIHHNTYTQGQREISEEMMFVLQEIHEGQTREVEVSENVQDAIKIKYYDIFYGDSRKYEKDPLGINDEMVIGIGVMLKRSEDKDVFVASPDAHVSDILIGLGGKTSEAWGLINIGTASP